MGTEVGERDWQELRNGWERYSETVVAWLELSGDPDADPDLVDGLVHQVISEHREWADALNRIIRATHHH